MGKKDGCGCDGGGGGTIQVTKNICWDVLVLIIKYLLKKGPWNPVV